jgi:FAD/FMN-containing dehydrogenase
MSFESWGRYPTAIQEELSLSWRTDPLPFPDKSMLPVGLGRSYGDVCLNDGGALLHIRKLNRLISFDDTLGILRCEAGVSLAEILRFAVPRGWFLPVTPGTKYVTLGGAIANDVHGKNHHQSGTFGRYVTQFLLRRSTNEDFLCSPTENPPLFEATIGGMGLTGAIIWAEVQLKPIQSSLIDMESTKFSNLQEFFEISKNSHNRFEYTVAWIDCLSSGDGFGRGIFMGGNHSIVSRLEVRESRKLAVPFDMPAFLLKKPTMQLFNTLYYHRQLPKKVFVTTSYDPFFYPLDAVLHWNRAYGRKGFFQFQTILSREDTTALLHEIVRSGMGSFLAVLKEFGEIPSPGLMSFPRAGVTLALDFANHGPDTLSTLKRFDAFVRERGGRIYPGKDAVMSAESFRQSFPQWETFANSIDPKFSSSFWRRVTASS